MCAVEDRLVTADPIPVQPEALLAALQAGEYFYNVTIEFESDPSLAGGIMDSAYLFVDGDEPVLEAVAARFRQTELVD